MYKKENLFLASLILLLIFFPSYWLFYSCIFFLFIIFLNINNKSKFVFSLILILVAIRMLGVDNTELEYKNLSDVPYVNLLAKICAEPDVRREEIKYTFCLEEFDFRIMWSADLYPRFEYGDTLNLSGSLVLPTEDEDFSYRNYLKIYKVGYLFKVTSYSYIASDDTFLKNVYRFKEKILKVLDQHLHEPFSSLAAGLLLGVKRGFSDQIMNELKYTGLTHLIAVSGFNISLIIIALNKSLFLIPRFIRFYCIVIILVLFGVITGFSPSVLRAIIMGIIAVLALEVGSEVKFFRIILVAALIMFFINPYTIWYDAGFHLSFLATLGVVYLSKFFNVTFLPSQLGLRESFALTIASQIATMPVIIFNFGLVSIVSPIANLLVAPLIPILMLLSFLLILAFNFEFLRIVLILLISSISKLFFIIMKFCSEMPISYFEI